MDNILLKNGKVAMYQSTRYAKIPKLNIEYEADIHLYMTPCPICDYQNPCNSLDGIFFVTFQITCKYCGIVYSPIVDPQESTRKLQAKAQQNN